MTAPEQKLWLGYLRKLPMTILRQKIINNYIVDFYYAKAKLIIEIDGESHFEKDAKEYDIIRTKVFEGYGLKVLRFTNIEVMRNLSEVGEKISAVINNTHG